MKTCSRCCRGDTSLTESRSNGEELDPTPGGGGKRLRVIKHFTALSCFNWSDQGWSQCTGVGALTRGRSHGYGEGKERSSGSSKNKVLGYIIINTFVRKNLLKLSFMMTSDQIHLPWS